MFYDITRKTYLERYDCISNIPPKHKLVLFILDQVNIGFKLQDGINRIIILIVIQLIVFTIYYM